MKNKQDIEKIFQDNRHGLDERPSGRAWNRLESRLDGHRTIQRRPRPAFRIMGMAAGLLFLVSMIALMSILFRQNSEMTASVEALPVPVMEELGEYDNEKGVYAIAVSFQKYLNQSPKIIAEGSGNKRLKSPREITLPGNPAKPRGPIAQTEEKKAAKNESIPTVKKQDATTKEQAPVNSAGRPTAHEQIAKMEPAEELEYASPIEDAADLAMADEIAEYDVLTEDGATLTSEEVALEDQPKAQKSKSRTAEAPTTYADRSAKDLNAASNAISYSTNAADAGVEQFQWLIGQWQSSESSNQQNVEQWEQKNAFTIEGSGQLVVNGDTTFTEGMKIQKIDDHLYYILALDEKHQAVRFKLRSIDPQIAVFETDKKGVPNQLILQQHSLNNYSATLQNIAPEKSIKDKQQLYLQNRNYIEKNNRTVRNMSRSY